MPQSKKGKQGGKKAEQGRSIAPYIPRPVINDWAPVSRKVFVFLGNSATNLPIVVTRACLLSLMVSINTNVATVFIPIITSIRIRRVKIFVQGAASSFTFQWVSDNARLGLVTISNSGTQGMEKTYYPPANTRCGTYSNAGSLTATLEEVMFTLSSISGNEITVQIDTDCVFGPNATAIITGTA